MHTCARTHTHKVRRIKSHFTYLAQSPKPFKASHLSFDQCAVFVCAFACSPQEQMNRKGVTIVIWYVVVLSHHNQFRLKAHKLGKVFFHHDKFKQGNADWVTMHMCEIFWEGKGEKGVRFCGIIFVNFYSCLIFWSITREVLKK